MSLNYTCEIRQENAAAFYDYLISLGVKLRRPKDTFINNFDSYPFIFWDNDEKYVTKHYLKWCHITVGEFIDKMIELHKKKSYRIKLCNGEEIIIEEEIRYHNDNNFTMSFDRFKTLYNHYMTQYNHIYDIKVETINIGCMTLTRKDLENISEKVNACSN